MIKNKPTTVYYIKTYERDEEDYAWYEVNNQLGYFQEIEQALEAVSKSCRRKVFDGYTFTFGDNRWDIKTIETMTPEKYI